MKKIILILAAASMMLSIASSCGSKTNGNADSYIMPCDSTLCEPTSNANTEDIIAIRKTLDLYVEAAIHGDSKVAEPAFAANATISHVENDVLVCAPIKELFAYYDATGKQSASYEISQYSIVGNVAMVRIESKFGETEFSDMFTFAKNGKDWKIVSKVYYVK